MLRSEEVPPQANETNEVASTHLITESDCHLLIFPGRGQTLFITPDCLESGSKSLESLFMYGVSHALALQGGLALHGAAFQHAAFSPLILGDSRSGKSTLTALALRMGAKVVSDDHLVLSRVEVTGTSVFELESMRPDLHLRSPSHRLLPEALALGLKPANFNGEQRWTLHHQSNPQFQRTANPTVILCSKIDRRLKETTVQSMAPAAVLAELMRSSSPLFLSAKFPQERAILMNLMLALITRIPAFQLRLGRDLFDKPEQTFQRLTETLS